MLGSGPRAEAMSAIEQWLTPGPRLFQGGDLRKRSGPILSVTMLTRCLLTSEPDRRTW